jgi:hypothetical protein
LNDTLTAESVKKSEDLSKVDLMPQSIKDWYVKNRTDRLLPIEEYKNEELGDVWNMEMVADYKTNPKVVDTIKKALDTMDAKKGQKLPIQHSIKKDSAALLQKKKKKTIRPKNVNHT